VLEVENLTVAYGGIVAVRDASLRVPRGRIVALIGGNGAGKTTLLNAICGAVPTRAGEVRFDGQSLVGQPPHRVARRGVLLVPEGRQILAPLSVRENLELGRLAARGRAETREQSIGEIYRLFPRLEERTKQPAGSLSGGEQQMLAIGRALMGRPEILLLDEPSLGLAPKLAASVFAALQTLNQNGLTILLVEQNARRALELATHGYVMERGEIVDAGPCERLRHDPRVVVHYLGGELAQSPNRGDSEYVSHSGGTQ
jgi:branched-chain amino acid transport system ATP-binding protein